MTTAFALVPDTRITSEPAAAMAMDRAIRVSTAAAVLAVAIVAVYGVTALWEPTTIDGLVYASLMVNLYAARHRLPVPSLAC